MTTSEKRLLGILGLIALGGGLFTGGKAAWHKQSALETERAELRASQAEAMIDLQTESTWAARRAWIQAHQPVLRDEVDTGAQTLDSIVKSAQDQHLEIQERNLGQMQRGPAGARIETEIKVKGSLESLCRWIAALQQPENFYAIDLFSLQADPDQKSTDCSLRIARIFREGNK